MKRSAPVALSLSALLVSFGCGGESRTQGRPGPGQGGSSATGGTANPGAAAYGAFPTMIGEGGRTLCGDGGCVKEPIVDPIEPPGPSLCGGVECAPGEACCMLSSTCFDPLAEPEACAPPPPDDDPTGRTPCSSNAQCESFEFCRADNRELCQGPGHCHPIANCGGCGGSGGSTFESCAVCGCDGNTYPDFQTACLARVNTALVPGPCGVPTTTGGGGSGGVVQTVTPCGADANCAESERCCAITGLCYPVTAPGKCQTPPAGTSFPCATNDDCGPNDYCLAEGCSAAGGCAPRNTDDCGVTFEPVCGCDGTTYTSDACASERGVRVRADGTCPED